VTTASSLARVLACHLSEILPRVESESEAAAAGTSRHTYLENVSALGSEKALLLVPKEHREMCEAIDIEDLPVGLAGEVAFAWDWVTGNARELGRGLARDYSKCSETEIAGTIDVVGISPTRLYVGDYKGEELVAAEGNAQLMFAAMCAAKIFGRSEVEAEIINVRASGNWHSKATFDLFELSEFEDTLRKTMRLIQLAKAPVVYATPANFDMSNDFSTAILVDGEKAKIVAPTFDAVEGEHCKYCPSFTFCPAKTALLREMSSIDRLEPITKSNEREFYFKFKSMQKMMARVYAAMYSYAESNPIDLGDGTWFAKRKKRGNESIDGDAAFDLLKGRYGIEYADLAVSRETSKKGIERAVRLAKKNDLVHVTQKSENESILVELRASGAAVRKPSTKVEEYRPKPGELPS
jgi:hypothetical protein